MLKGSLMLRHALTSRGGSSTTPAPSQLPDLPEQGTVQRFPTSVSSRPAGRPPGLKSHCKTSGPTPPPLPNLLQHLMAAWVRGAPSIRCFHYKPQRKPDVAAPNT